MSDFVPCVFTIGDVTFDHVAYSEHADELTFRLFPWRELRKGCETKEDDPVAIDRSGRLFQVSIQNARWRLEQDGLLMVTLPNGSRTAFLTREQVEPLMVERPAAMQ